MTSFRKCVAGGLLAISIFGLPLVSRAAETIELLLAHDQSQVPDNTSLAVVADEFRRQAGEVSGGRIKVDILPNSMLGTNRDMALLVERNVLHSAVVPIGAAAFVFPPMLAAAVPFSFESVDVARAVMNGPFRQRLNQAMAAGTNLRLLGFVDVGGFDIVTNFDRDIEFPDDMWGLNILSSPDLPEMDALIKATGARAVKVSAREKFNALGSHALDGQTGTIDLALAQGLSAVQGHATLTNHLYAPYAWLFSRSALDALAPSDQALILKAAETALSRTLERTIAAEKAGTSLSALYQAMKVRVLSLDEREKFRAVMQQAGEQAILSSLGPDGVRLVEEFKDAVRAARSP
ncbi:MAG: TRAP transporter substrate-binding protein DctP [Magnetospirillum sp. WYHS-4]